MNCFQGNHFQGKCFQGKLFQGKLSQGKLFPGQSFQGQFFQGKRGMRLPFPCAGVDKYGPVSYPGPPRGLDEVAVRL